MSSGANAKRNRHVERADAIPEPPEEIFDARKRVSELVLTFATSSRDHQLKMLAIDDLLTLERHLIGLAEPC